MRSSTSNAYADILRHDFPAFIHRAFQELYPGTSFDPNWHIELMAAKLEQVRRGGSNRCIINLPPGHLKSFVVSVVLPAWILGHDPAKQLLVISYGQDLADKFARQCRKLMESEFYRFLFATRISEEHNTVAEFETTQAGCRRATSIGGSVTGWRGDLIIIDEPLKADEALSDVRRRAVNEWYRDALPTRLNRPGRDPILIVAQRLHADDLVGFVQQTEDWDILSLPAIAEETEHYRFVTPYGRRTIRRRAGEALHPARVPVRELDRIRRTIGGYNFAAQYQQDPEPPAGVIVHRDWLSFYGYRERPERFDTILQSWDTANKVTELSDYSVCTTWGIKMPHAYLLDVFRERLEFPDLRRMVLELATRWQAQVVLVEDKSSGTQLIQDLRRSGFSRVEASPALDGDKVMRLRAQTPKIEGGFVHFPIDAHWLDDYLRELLSFPNSKHDDQVDSTVFALAWMLSHQWYGWTDKASENFGKVIDGIAFQSLFGF